MIKSFNYMIDSDTTISKINEQMNKDVSTAIDIISHKVCGGENNPAYGGDSASYYPRGKGFVVISILAKFSDEDK